MATSVAREELEKWLRDGCSKFRDAYLMELISLGDQVSFPVYGISGGLPAVFISYPMVKKNGKFFTAPIEMSVNDPLSAEYVFTRIVKAFIQLEVGSENVREFNPYGGDFGREVIGARK